ncbi:MAG: hypothetical protein IJ422_09635 [Oscillospiraceae bacterium]|nr:hypothetical protein [Oscillospiraceae bacterium]
MKNLFEHTSAYWAKYAAYEWRKAPDGKEYLLPTADAKSTVYNAMPLADQLVLDAVNIGLLVMHKSPEQKVKDAIHRFACDYGLLGMMSALPTTPKFVEYEKVYLLKNQFIRQETMDTLAYMRLFFPFKMPDFHKRGIESVWNVSGSDREEAALALTFSEEPRSKALSFMRSYGEPYEWLKEMFLDWAFTFMASFLYYRDRDILDENALDMYRRGLACFEGNAPTYHLVLREHPVIVWDFHSLMLTVKFLFSVKLTDTKNPMRICEHCRMAFYAHRADSRYCSAECRNKAGKKP